MKNYSTYAALLTDTPNEARLLDEWLDERSAEHDAEKLQLPREVSGITVDRERLAAACEAYDGDIRPGQIRILSKRFTADPDVIPYVAVLERRDEGKWLVAPFSPYSVPATPGEMATGVDICGLRVVQAWNGQTVQEALLAKSFLFSSLGESVRVAALDLVRHETNGADLPADFSAQRGPTVILDADPRRDYQGETLARLRPLVTAVKAMERWRTESSNLQQGSETVLQPLWGAEKCGERLAAEEKEHQITENYLVCETELSLSYSPEERLAILTFYDKDDRPDAAYDGYGLLGADGEFLGAFRDGYIRVSADCIREGFRIVDSEGSAVTIRKS